MFRILSRNDFGFLSVTGCCSCCCCLGLLSGDRRSRIRFGRTTFLEGGVVNGLDRSSFSSSTTMAIGRFMIASGWTELRVYRHSLVVSCIVVLLVWRGIDSTLSFPPSRNVVEGHDNTISERFPFARSCFLYATRVRQHAELESWFT